MNTLITSIINKYFRFAFLRKLIWTVILFIVFAVCFIIILPDRNVKTKPVGWERQVFISPGRIRAKNASVASRGNFVVVAYEGKQKKVKGVYASVSFRKGRSFLPPVKIAEIKTQIDNNPHVAISGNGHITIAWHNFIEEEATNRIFYSISTDMGASWSKPVKAYIGYEMEMIPRVYYDKKNRLHLFFHAYKGVSFNLYHARTGDKKKFKVLGPLIKLTKNIRGAFFPAILFSGRGIYVAWQSRGRDFKDDIFFKKSSNYGNSWSSTKKITDSKGSNSSPSLLLYRDTMYMAYRNNDQKSWSIKLMKGHGRGRIWIDKPVAISKTNADCYMPKIALSKNKIVIVWYDLREKRSKIFSRNLSLFDFKFSNELKLSLRPYSAKKPKTVSVGNMVSVFWEESGRIFAKLQDTYVAPPKVYSSTHPKGKWTRNTLARIRWKAPKDPSGIAGYSVLVTKPTKDGDMISVNPTIQNVKGYITQRMIPQLEDGITYFHIRAIDGAGNYSRTIHFPVRVSANPLPMPFVVSTTHPQGKSGKTNSPVFKWELDDVVRLKGFIYALSKDRIKDPSRFTTDFNIKFKDLKEGQYFFSLQAVDKTNMKSRVSPYVFFIGKAGKVDPEYLKKIAKGETRKKGKYKRKKPPGTPAIDISFPFDITKPFESDSFKAIISIKNIRPERVVGFSIFIDKEKREIVKKVNYKSKILNIEGLRDGDYYIGAKCSYYRVIGRKKKYFWTKPHLSKISIQKIKPSSPIGYYTEIFASKMSGNVRIITVILLSLILSILTIGFSSKLLYYLKLVQYKFKLYLKLFS